MPPKVKRIKHHSTLNSLLLCQPTPARYHHELSLFLRTGVNVCTGVYLCMCAQLRMYIYTGVQVCTCVHVEVRSQHSGAFLNYSQLLFGFGNEEPGFY